MVWHLDVGLSFPKSVGSLIGGSAHLAIGHCFPENKITEYLFSQKKITESEKKITEYLKKSRNFVKNHGILPKYPLFSLKIMLFGPFLANLGAF